MEDKKQTPKKYGFASIPPSLYKGPWYGNKVKMWIGDKEIIGTGSWKVDTIPWYLRWWYWLKVKRIYKRRRDETI